MEHPFLRLNRLFGYGKVHYRGLVRNMERLARLFGLGNMLAAGVQLWASSVAYQRSRSRGVGARIIRRCKSFTPTAPATALSP